MRSPSLARVVFAAVGLLLPACTRDEGPSAPLPPPVLEIAPAESDAPEEPAAAAAEAPPRTSVSISARDEPPTASDEAPAPGELPPAQVKLLEDLLRLPSGAGRVAPDSMLLQLPKPEAEAEADKKTEKSTERSVQVEFGTRKDAWVIDPDKARTRTDAGVAVEVGKDTKVRTGVRVEQETGLEHEQPHPTVGIERRF
ncbi:MAG: hypothetical protein AMS19_14810 [Gemmatimonas sp. SG8_23]|nr:MAG: hypothetical protein AMS19_14810 [Gemmatimonas sp. SG8_23]